MSFSRSRWAGRSGRSVAGAVLGTMFLLAGCGGGGGDGGTTNPTPAISIALSSSSLAVVQGTAGNVTVNLTRSGGFAGDVAVAVTGLPTGVTVSSTTIASAASSATLTFVATATATTGNANITVTATGSGVTASTATLALTISAAAGTGGFTLAVNPTSATLTQGQSATAVVTITRTGSFTGAVNLTVTGAANGLSATLAAASTTGTTDTLTLTATGTATTGAQNLSIKGTATGLTDQTIPLPVTVNAQSSSGNVTWQFCGTLGIPLWVATQDGTGAWTHVTGTNDAYTFNVTNFGGIAYVLSTGTGFDIEVFYGSKADLQGRSNEVCNGAAGAGKTVTAPIAGNSAGDAILASLGPSSGTLAGSTLTFKGVPNGNVDLIAGRTTITVSGTGISFNLAKMLIRRNLNPATGSALSTVDFGSTEAFTPVTKNLTISNLGTDVSALLGLYFTTNNTFASYFTDFSGGGATRTYPGVPSANQAAGDLHVLAIVGLASLTGTAPTREALFAFHDATDKTLALGPPLNTPTVSALTATGYARLRAALTVQPEYNKDFTFQGSQTGAVPRSFNIQQTAGYSGASSLNLDLPDFSGVAGFDVNWGPKVGTLVNWTVSGIGFPGSVGITQPPFSEGASYMFANRPGTITP